MAEKKVTVLGDAGDGSLTPEEEHKIEVKIDKMLAVDAPAETVAEPEQKEESAAVSAVAKPEPVPEEKPAETEMPEESVEHPIVVRTSHKVIMPIHKDLVSEAPTPPAAKSIAIKGDSDEVSTPAEPVTEPVAKSPTKITITSPAEDDEEPPVAKSAPPLKKGAPKSKKIAIGDADKEAEAEPKPKAKKGSKAKASKKKAVAPVAEAVAAEPVVEMTEAASSSALKPAELPKSPLKIQIDTPELEVIPSADLKPESDEEESAEPDVEPVAPVSDIDALDSVPVADDELLAETPAPTAAPETEAVEEAEVTPLAATTPETPEANVDSLEPSAIQPAPPAKKYRPPDGPIPFKRATISEEAATTPAAALDSQQAEDEALARAFEPQPSPKGEKQRSTGSKKLLWTLVALVVVAALVAIPITQPKLRTRLTNLVHGTKSAATTPPKTTPKASVSTTSLTTPTASQTFLNEDVFMSKQAGKYNVYKVDGAGQNKVMLLAGTGNEDGKFALVTNDEGDTTALVATRDTQKDSAGYLLQSLTVIDVKTGANTVIVHAQQIRLLGWFGDRLMYVTVKTGASTTDATAYQLMSYSRQTKQSQQLDAANNFTSLLAAKGTIYYATTGADATTAHFQMIKADGTGKRTILNSAIWHIYRTGYNELTLAGTKNWYTMSLTDNQPVTTTNAYDGTGRQYVDSPDGKHSVYLQTTGKQSALVLVDSASAKELTLLTQSNLSYPVRWLNNTTLDYRVSGSSETADYSLAISSQSPTKLADVSDSTGVTIW